MFIKMEKEGCYQATVSYGDVKLKNGEFNIIVLSGEGVEKQTQEKEQRILRSLSDTRMLKLQRFNCKTHGFRTFSHFGPHIWNNLPQDIRHSATLSSFKSKLKTFLFSEYFS